MEQMKELVEYVLEAAAEHALWQPHDTIVVAVSGGRILWLFCVSCMKSPAPGCRFIWSVPMSITASEPNRQRRPSWCGAWRRNCPSRMSWRSSIFLR